MNARFLLAVAAACGSLLGLCGCGSGDLPELGNVYGVVRFNGEPLPRAKVMFRHDSEAGGRMASGITDSQGEYELLYIQYPEAVYGAKAGPQKVIITTLLRDEDPGGPRPETLPECYRGKDSILTAHVEPGVTNEINFDLTEECTH